jgi:outer membrane protein assembly factor BamB
MKSSSVQRNALLAVAVLGCGLASADWPTYMHDAMRSGVTTETLPLPLHEAWEYQPLHPPRPAWPAPAKQDFWHEIPKLHPLVTYDRAYHAVIADGLLYFASSADDQVYCLDAATAALRWTFFAEAPIRLAPTIAEGKAYFSADDGCVYCLDAASGKLLWKHRPPASERRIPGNGRLVSVAPARTGVLVDNGVAYYASGLFPSVGVYRGALNAATGAPIWCERTDDVSPQGYLLASPTRLFVPTGRTNPAVFERDTAKPLGALEGPGGAFAVLVDDAMVSGPGRQTGNTLQFSDPQTRESIATAPGTRMVVQGPMAYIQSLDRLAALDRPPFLELGRKRTVQAAERDKIKKQQDAAKNRRDAAAFAECQGRLDAADAGIAELDKAMEACYRWRVSTEHPYALVLASDVLFAGGDGDVAAFSTKDGAPVWNAAVNGRAYGLSVSDGRLYVSTDLGSIHCFSAAPVKEKQVLAVKPVEDAYAADPQGNVWKEIAERVVNSTGISQGYALVLGCGEGRLAYALAQCSNLSIIALEKDPDQAERARRRLSDAGLYGPRVTVQQWAGSTLPYTTYLANLIVAGESFDPGDAPAAAEVYRVLRPYGGTAYIGQPAGLSEAALEAWLAPAKIESTIAPENGLWATFTREAVTGSGEWTQLYADSGHTACSMDPLEGPMTVQWFGEPGPRDIVDRHHRPMSSLFKNGRLFIPGDNVVMCADGYNGSPLWRLEVPDMRRVGAMKDSGQMLLTEDYLYVAAKGECWAIKVETGERAFTIPLPDTGGEAYDWGYLDCAGDQLLGTAEKPDASFDLLSKVLVNTLEGDFRPVIVSRYLFCVDRHTGEPGWTYRNGAIMNSAIAVAEGRAYFVESLNDAAMNTADGRIRIDHFCKSDTHLVALDLASGKKLWERPVLLPFEHIMFLNGADGVLVATGSYNEGQRVFYGLFGFDMASGQDLWNTSFRALDNRSKGYSETGGSHGEQWQHPVLVRGTIYQRPFAFDLHTGEKKEYIARRGGHGCGGLTGSMNYLYGRGDNPRMYPLNVPETEGIQLTEVSRPGCWLNIIPAGGIIMVPESSSGCTCGYAVQASFGFIPERLLTGPS